MNFDTVIPESRLALVTALRGTFRPLGEPWPPSAAIDWTALFHQARAHGIDTFLYPWLTARFPDLFSVRTAAPDSVPAAWRVLFMQALTKTLQRQRQLKEIVSAFEHARIEPLIVKGAWLAETVYDDPVQRSMCDLDVLIRGKDCDTCHAILQTLHYAAKTERRHNRFAYDQVYLRPGTEYPLELHWHVTSDLDSDTLKPDIDAIWRQTLPARYQGVPVRSLPPADQLAHQIQHILHHRFAMPLRGYLDIALLVRKFGDGLSPDALTAAGGRWKTGRGIPFLLRMACDLFDRPLPDRLADFAPPLPPDRLAQAAQALFGLSAEQVYQGETALLRFSQANPFAKVRLMLSRIFMPRAFLTMEYPCARHVAGLPCAWVRRARDLYRRHRSEIRSLCRDGHDSARLVGHSSLRADLVEWLLRG